MPTDDIVISEFAKSSTAISRYGDAFDEIIETHRIMPTETTRLIPLQACLAVIDEVDAILGEKMDQETAQKLLETFVGVFPTSMKANNAEIYTGGIMAAIMSAPKQVAKKAITEAIENAVWLPTVGAINGVCQDLTARLRMTKTIAAAHIVEHGRREAEAVRTAAVKRSWEERRKNDEH